LCLETNGILYTRDSVITTDISTSKLARSSFFTFHVEWESKLLVFREDFKAYFAITKNDEVVIKGDELPPKIVLVMAKLAVNAKHWLLPFKAWFMNCNPSLFITNKRRLYLQNNKIIDSIESNIVVPNIDREYYWLKLLKYINAFNSI